MLQTLTAGAHDAVALLRLDTDTYATTLHELTTLYDRIPLGGIVIVDDYGHCQGARNATDEFFANRPRLFFQRPEYSSRTALKF